MTEIVQSYFATSPDYYYGEGSYDSDSYQGGSTGSSSSSSGSSTSSGGSAAAATTTPASTATSSGGVLTNTGFYIAVIVTIAFVIALSALIVRFWKKPVQTSS